MPLPETRAELNAMLAVKFEHFKSLPGPVRYDDGGLAKALAKSTAGVSNIAYRPVEWAGMVGSCELAGRYSRDQEDRA